MNQHIKQLQMNRNRKEINLAKPIREFKTENVSYNMILERPILINEHKHLMFFK